MRIAKLIGSRLTTDDGKEYKVFKSPDTKITLNGQKSHLSELTVGDEVQCSSSREDGELTELHAKREGHNPVQASRTVGFTK